MSNVKREILFLKFCLKSYSIDWPRSENSKMQAEITGVYRGISLLERLWDSSCAPALIPWTKAITYWLIVLSSYSTIKFYSMLPLLVYACYPVVATVFLFEILIVTILMSKIYTVSYSLQKNINWVEFSHSGKKGEFRRIVHSFRPLRCRMGQFYFVQKSTPLTVFSLVLDQVISLLLAF